MKNTIQQYGWIVITVIIIAILIGISAPAAMYLRDNVVDVVGGFGDLMPGDNSSGGGSEEGGSEDEIVPGLYQTGSNYTVLITPWDELVSSGAIVVNNGAVSRGTALPEKNEYGFYYDVQYLRDDGFGFVFYEDTSFDFYVNGELVESVPAGNIAYSVSGIDLSAMGGGIATVSDDGLSITANGDVLTASAEDSNEPAELPGDLMLPTDGSITSIGSGIKSRAAAIEQPRVGFGYCTTLTGIRIPDSVTNIGEAVFYECTNITNVTFGENSKLENIGKNAFIGCTNLTNIKVPNNVTSISEDAFRRCTSLTNINIPDSVTRIGEEAFLDCLSLKSITFGENSQLTSIGYGTFAYCESLTSIEIPDSVTSISDYAFENCTSLKIVYYTGLLEQWCQISFGLNRGNPCSNGAELYIGGVKQTNVVIPSTITEIKNATFEGCTSLVSIMIPNSVKSIGSCAFINCANLTKVEIPNAVTSIGASAFNSCTSLTNVEIPDSVTSIGEQAFFGCVNLTKVEIPDNITTISKQTFAYCSNLTSIEISNNVTRIREQAFCGCIKLDTVTFKGTAAQWNAITLDGYWNTNVPATEVICSDGTVSLN